MRSKTVPDVSLSLGALLRRPYERLVEWVYADMASAGFDDVRPAYSVVLRNVPVDGIHVSGLAVTAGMTKQSMAYLVEQMEKAGLVLLEPDPHDRRAKVVRLTSRALEASHAAVALSKRYEAHFETLVGAGKMKLLRQVLTELHAQLDAAEPPLAAEPRALKSR